VLSRACVPAAHRQRLAVDVHLADQRSAIEIP
jgi:hypothetical protein